MKCVVSLSLYVICNLAKGSVFVSVFGVGVVCFVVLFRCFVSLFCFGVLFRCLFRCFCFCCWYFLVM